MFNKYCCGGLLFLMCFVFGCNPSKTGLKAFNKAYEIGDFNQASLLAQSKISKSEKPKSSDLLWTMQLASVSFVANDHNMSADCFDKCERMLNYFDLKNETASAVASTIVNDNAVPYLGEEYDGVMINIYKALDFMILQKPDLVRVEFNRAMERQARSKEYFAKSISRLQEEIENTRKKNKNAQIDKNIDNPKVKSLLEAKYSELSGYEVYPDFVNPFANYLAGVYFNLVNDNLKAGDLLKEAHGMVPENPYITADYNATEKVLEGGGKIENTVWVIFENGLGPVKEEFRLDLPLFLVTNRVYYTGIALPRLKSRQSAYSSLIIGAEGANYETKVVADMEKIIRTEFKNDFKAILTRAIVSASVKAAAQYAMTQQNSSGASMAAAALALYSLATNAADVRIWTTLPKDFQAARLAIPGDRMLSIASDGGAKLLDITIPKCNNAIVYIKIPVRNMTPSCDVILF